MKSAKYRMICIELFPHRSLLSLGLRLKSRSGSVPALGLAQREKIHLRYYENKHVQTYPVDDGI